MISTSVVVFRIFFSSHSPSPLSHQSPPPHFSNLSPTPTHTLWSTVCDKTITNIHNLSSHPPKNLFPLPLPSLFPPPPPSKSAKIHIHIPFVTVSSPFPFPSPPPPFPKSKSKPKSSLPHSQSPPPPLFPEKSKNSNPEILNSYSFILIPQFF